MPGLSFLSKKSWHTSNISNQEKVWIAEQKAAAEDLKLKELTQQIKLEREQEELQKITGQKSSSTGDRGVDWMYEGHKKGEGDEERRKQEDAQQNEAYLMGKEFVPEGQTKHAGDFAVAASMTGALEKASTVGATIGVSGGERVEEGAAVLRIQDDGMTNNDGTVESSSSVAAASSTMNEWNQNFHLRHEDPMFSVMQRKQAKDKDVEKKIKLMERAGMVVNKGTTTEPDVEAEKKVQHDEQEDKDRERRRRKDSKKSKKKRKHKHKSHRRHQKRSRRERSRSPSSDDGYSSYSSSASYSSEDSRRGRRHVRKDDGKMSYIRRHDDDDYDRHHSSDRRRDRHDDRNHCRKRSESRERRRRERSPERHHDDYDRYERQSERGATSGRRRERSRSYSMDREDPRGERRSRGDDYRDYKGGDSRSSRRENDRYKYDDRKQPAKGAAAVAAAPPEGDSRPKKEGYGLIGTSLSKSNNNSTSSKPSNGSGNYLGPDQKLREAKREEMEKERQSRFGHGRKRQYRETSEERQMALEEMQRNAREREKKWSK